MYTYFLNRKTTCMIYFDDLHYLLYTIPRKSDGKRFNDRRIVVDVERGRTAKGWRPMRLGGGLGGRKPKKSKKEIEKELQLKKLQERKNFSYLNLIKV